MAEDKECHLTASYLTDAFGKLLASAVGVLLECRKIEFSFEEEPGEYRWVLDLSNPNMLALEVLEFESQLSRAPHQEGKSLFKLDLPPFHYVLAVYVAADLLLEERGEAGYAKKWSRYPFPIDLYRMLRRALRQDDA